MVAPLVGAWIEIVLAGFFDTTKVVAPLVGAWIEIALLTLFDNSVYVAPLVGAWIEITITGNSYLSAVSLPSWERGLKLLSRTLMS